MQKPLKTMNRRNAGDTPADPQLLYIAIQAIVDELDGEVWTPDTLERIAHILREAGYEIREPWAEVEP